MASRPTTGAMYCIVAALLVTRFDQVLGLGGSYVPQRCKTNGCPSVAWTFSSLNQTGNFTITSSPNRTRTDNYVSFAFANGTGMADALFVVDCYEPTGAVFLGTSRNIVVNGHQANVDDPSFQSNLTNTSATKINGTLTCAFTLGYSMNALATSSIYIQLAEGYMNTTANASNSPPKKLGHFQKSTSSASFQAMALPATNASSQATALPATTQSTVSMPSAAGKRGQMWQYAVAFLCLTALAKSV